MLLLGKHGLPAICSVDLPLWPTLTRWLIDWNRQRSTCGPVPISIHRDRLWFTPESELRSVLTLYMYSLCYTHTHPFNGPFSGTTWVSRYQKGKTNLDLLKQETVSSSGVSWTICKSAPRSRQVTTPASHHSVFYRPDAFPAAQPTASKHWRQVQFMLN